MFVNNSLFFLTAFVDFYLNSKYFMHVFGSWGYALEWIPLSQFQRLQRHIAGIVA